MMNKDTAISLYYQMLRIRLVEERIAELYSEQQMRCPLHLCIGQEAVPAGVCAHLSNKDCVFSSHRSHGHYLAKGGNLKAMFAELYGKITGCSQGKGGSMHLIDLAAGFLGATPIVASTIPIAVGAAMGSIMRSIQRLTVVFFGDAAVEEGVFHESINFAVLKKLPVVFVCENNFYSVNTPLSERQPQGREISQLASGHGLESFQGDGNDVIEVYNLAEQAIQRTRQAEGPTFLEFKTYRWREHCGPNYDHLSGCRSESELQLWIKRCPIERLKIHLLEEGMILKQEIEAMVNKAKVEIEEAVKFAKESPFPEESFLFKDIYAQ